MNFHHFPSWISKNFISVPSDEKALCCAVTAAGIPPAQGALDSAPLFSARTPEEAAQLNSPLPSLQHPRSAGGKGPSARGLFLGLKWIQLWAAPAATSPLSPRTELQTLPQGKLSPGSTKNPTKAFSECLCWIASAPTQESTLTGSVMLSPGKSFQFRVLIFVT